MHIQHKLFSVLLITRLALVGIMFALMQWSIDHGMLDYINTKEADNLQPLVDKLTQIYAEQKSWKTLA